MGQAGSHASGPPHLNDRRRSLGGSSVHFGAVPSLLRQRNSSDDGSRDEGQPIQSQVRPRATTDASRAGYPSAGRRNTLDLSSTSILANSVDSASAKAFAASDMRRKLPTIFKYPGQQAKEVYLSGSFNGWQKMKMSRSTKDFVAIVDLPEGEYKYKFWVDGHWVSDPATSPTADSSQASRSGTVSNVIKVMKEDFDAYDALDMDSEAVSKAAALKRQQNPLNLVFSQQFSQDIPSKELLVSRTGPPILPPHLLQVILNRDTPMSCEPTLLPEPNHVMLNHLYALSIKEGVMVLSATNRYKKKYVTSLLYKPMPSKTIPSY